MRRPRPGVEAGKETDDAVHVVPVDDVDVPAEGPEACVERREVEHKLAAFGWDVHVVDGHDHDALGAALDAADAATDRPSAIIARTTFGKGVTFMESKIEWHYMPLTAEQHEQALGELEVQA